MTDMDDNYDVVLPIKTGAGFEAFLGGLIIDSDDEDDKNLHKKHNKKKKGSEKKGYSYPELTSSLSPEEQTEFSINATLMSSDPDLVDDETNFIEKDDDEDDANVKDGNEGSDSDGDSTSESDIADDADEAFVDVNDAKDEDNDAFVETHSQKSTKSIKSAKSAKSTKSAKSVKSEKDDAFVEEFEDPVDETVSELLRKEDDDATLKSELTELPRDKHQDDSVLNHIDKLKEISVPDSIKKYESPNGLSQESEEKTGRGQEPEAEESFVDADPDEDEVKDDGAFVEEDSEKVNDVFVDIIKEDTDADEDIAADVAAELNDKDKLKKKNAAEKKAEVAEREDNIEVVDEPVDEPDKPDDDPIVGAGNANVDLNGALSNYLENIM